MRNMLPIVTIASTIAAPSIVRADATSPDTDEAPFRIGIGGLLSAGADATAGLLTIPIRIAPYLRLEPEFGGQYFRSSDRTSTTWLYSLGLGIAASWGTGPTRPTVGLRLGATEAGTRTSTEKLAEGGFYLGAVIGAEHFVTDALSIGAEARITYSAAGGGGVSIDAAIAARIYFN